MLREAGLLARIPGIIVRGALDLSNLVGTPWELAQSWPRSELVLVDDAGHSSRDRGMIVTLVTATDRFSARG